MPAFFEIEKLLCASLEEVLGKLYPATFFRWLYECAGLRVMMETCAVTPSGKVPPNRSPGDKTPNKSVLVEGVRTVLADKGRGLRFFEMLPQASRDAISILAWEQGVNLADLEKKIGGEIATANPDARRDYYEPFLLAPAHGFLVVVKTDSSCFSYYSSDRPRPKKDQYDVRLPDAVRRAFRTFVPPPADYELLPMDAVPDSSGCRYTCERKALADLRLVAEYIAQGHLKYTKSENVATPSLKAIHRLTGGPEFFENTMDTDLDLLRTRLLVGGMAFAGEKEREGLLAVTDSAAPVQALFASVAASGSFLHEELLGHLANAQNAWCAHNPSGIQGLAAFFGRLPAGRWVSWDNMRRYHTLREWVPSIFQKKAGGLQGRLSADHAEWTATIEVSERNAFELVGAPLLKGYAFLLASFGLAEIVYDLPENKSYNRPRKRYLTPYDGLRFVRLTPLGEYAYGLRKTYEVAAGTAVKASIILDDARLLATCRHADALTAMALGQFLEKLTPERYCMTPKSLVGGCKSRADIEERIRLFRRVVSANPPPVWERFFEKTLSRIAPLTHEADYIVLKVGSDEDFRRLFATDPELREIALKVEGLRIAVLRRDLKKLAKRLEQHGYLSPLSSLLD